MKMKKTGRLGAVAAILSPAATAVALIAVIYDVVTYYSLYGMPLDAGQLLSALFSQNSIFIFAIAISVYLVFCAVADGMRVAKRWLFWGSFAVLLYASLPTLADVPVVFLTGDVLSGAYIASITFPPLVLAVCMGLYIEAGEKCRKAVRVLSMAGMIMTVALAALHCAYIPQVLMGAQTFVNYVYLFVMIQQIAVFLYFFAASRPCACSAAEHTGGERAGVQPAAAGRPVYGNFPAAGDRAPSVKFLLRRKKKPVRFL